MKKLFLLAVLSAIAGFLALAYTAPADAGVSKGNDNFGDNVLIETLPYTNKQDTEDASTQTGEPRPCGLIGSTTWFTLRVPKDMIVRIDTEGSNFDTAVAVYTGELLTDLEDVECDDDSGPGLLSGLFIYARVGVGYHIQAGGFDGDTGNLVLNVEGVDNALHWKCYNAQVVSGTPRFQSRVIDLLDQFEEKETLVRYPKNFCAPASKVSGYVGGTAGNNHIHEPLTCYAIRDTSGQPKFQEQEETIASQFGVQRLIVHRPDRYCTTASKFSKTGNAAGVDRGLAFKCYTVRPVRGEPAFPRQNVRLQDQFTTVTMTALKAALFCALSAKDIEGCPGGVAGGQICTAGLSGEPFPLGHILCYQMRNAPGQSAFKRRNIGIEDQFGVLALQLRTPDLLCVSAIKDAPFFED